MSKSLDRKRCIEFDTVMKDTYLEEYLRLPTPSDPKSSSELHKQFHKIEGIFGSLDGMHTHWKNCHKASQSSFKGKEKVCYKKVMKTVAKKSRVLETRSLFGGFSMDFPLIIFVENDCILPMEQKFLFKF